MSFEFTVSHLFEITSGLGISFAAILIGIIIAKTPQQMKTYKFHLLLYTCHSLCLGIICGIYSPAMLHPYVFFYPLGIAKRLPRTLSIFIFSVTFYHSMCMFDCSIVMVLQRYYAMKKVTKSESNLPKAVFGFLSTASLCYLIFMAIAIFYEPLNYYFMVTPEESTNLINTVFGKWYHTNDIQSVIIFRGIEANSLPFFAQLITVLIGIRLIGLLGLLGLNAKQSQALNPAMMSKPLQKSHHWLIQMIRFQLVGTMVFIGIPLILVIFSAILISQPSPLVSYCFAFMNCFGFYDSIVTVVCIKPYRQIFVNFFKKFLRKLK